MSAGANTSDGATAVAKIAADSGVNLTSAEAAAIVRSLARIQTATAAFLQPPSFDETGERFYRLLEADAAEEAGR